MTIILPLNITIGSTSIPKSFLHQQATNVRTWLAFIPQFVIISFCQKEHYNKAEVSILTLWIEKKCYQFVLQSDSLGT